MVDVDHTGGGRMTQAAGLRRLSARANGSPTAAAAAGPRRLCCFSFAAYARGVIEHLRRCGVSVAPGLSEAEFGRIQSHLGFVFPPDLRAILQEGLPVGPSFPDWRSGSTAQLKARIEQPVTGLCQEVSKGRFWWNGWGNRPASGEQAVRVAAAELRRAPVLVPIYSHCYIPASGAAGNPVLFVRGGEVLCCGNDVADFFEREAFVPEQEYQQEHQHEEKLDVGGHGSCLSSVKSRLGSLRGSLEPSGSSSSSSEGSSSWGRSLDSLARNPEAFFLFRRKGKGSAAARMGELTSSRSADATPRPSVSASSSSGMASEPPRRSLDAMSIRRGKKPLPIEALLGFTMAAPAWAAKAPRRIEFWSEITDRCTDEDLPVAPAPEHDNESKQESPAPEHDNEHAAAASSKQESPKQATVQHSKQDHPDPCKKRDQCQQQQQQGWLDGYLHDMAGRLRTAGWKEDDISEMMVTSDPASNSEDPGSAKTGNLIQSQQEQSRQSVIQGLAFKVGELSDSLKKAGWSVQDVAEALGASSLSVWAGALDRMPMANPSKLNSPRFPAADYVVAAR